MHYVYSNCTFGLIMLFKGIDPGLPTFPRVSFGKLDTKCADFPMQPKLKVQEGEDRHQTPTHIPIPLLWFPYPYVVLESCFDGWDSYFLEKFSKTTWWVSLLFEDFFLLCWGLTTCQPLWVILCCLQRKGEER